MRPTLHLAASKLTLLFLAVLCLLPPNATAFPRSPAALLHLQVALEDDWLVRPGGGAEWRLDPLLALLSPGEEEEEEEEEATLRARRGDLVGRPLSPFPVGLSLGGVSYQEGGEDGGKRNEALTSIAGGLQAVGREKGGIAFRFGRKRWTNRGWTG
ncbi:uncharacterized protein qrfp [Pungitius pungitius]|uniref:uncharacterized protein qrfp n=1 Tax=Pungitius pungitius TaxID=134920 RepID=UPI002E15C057